LYSSNSIQCTFHQGVPYKPITNTAWGRARLCKLQKGCTRLAAANDKVYQLLAHVRWFSLDSSTTKSGRHDKAEILLKVALNTINQSINQGVQLIQKLLWKIKQNIYIWTSFYGIHTTLNYQENIFWGELNSHNFKLLWKNPPFF
jgi:hypothetical protein